MNWPQRTSLWVLLYLLISLILRRIVWCLPESFQHRSQLDDSQNNRDVVLEYNGVALAKLEKFIDPDKFSEIESFSLGEKLASSNSLDWVLELDQLCLLANYLLRQDQLGAWFLPELRPPLLDNESVNLINSFLADLKANPNTKPSLWAEQKICLQKTWVSSHANRSGLAWQKIPIFVS